MLDDARVIKGFFNKFSESTILGFPLDWFFHLFGAALIIYVGSRFLTLKRTVQLTIVLLILKEVFDIFAKTRLEYIRPPTLDLIVDLSAGVLGILAGCWLARRRVRLGSKRQGQGVS